MATSFPGALDMDASSWRQVRENMRRLAELFEMLGNLRSGLENNDSNDLTELINRIMNILADLTDRIGTITAITKNMTVNHRPDEYKYDITYEFKVPSAISIGDKNGFEGLTHCLLQTVRPSSVGSETNFTPYQIVVGKDLKQYVRFQIKDKNGQSIWGEWKEIRYGTQIMVKDTMPEDDEQTVGDLWLLKV